MKIERTYTFLKSPIFINSLI